MARESLLKSLLKSSPKSLLMLKLNCLLHYLRMKKLLLKLNYLQLMKPHYLQQLMPLKKLLKQPQPPQHLQQFVVQFVVLRCSLGRA